MFRSSKIASSAVVLLLAMVTACGQRATPAAPVLVRGGLDETTSPAASVTVQRGETLYAIARRYEVPVRALIEANNLAPPYKLEPGATLNVPAARRHLALPGETIYNVARRYGVDVSTLARLNGLAPPYTLHTGQALLLPAPVTQVATSSPAAPGGRTPAPVEYRVAPPAAPPSPPPAAKPAQVATAPSAGPPGPPPSSRAEPPPGVADPPRAAPSSTSGAPKSEEPPPRAGAAPAARQSAASPAAPPVIAPPPGRKPEVAVAPAEPPAPVSQKAPGEQVAALPPGPEPQARKGPRTFAWPISGGHVIAEFGPSEGGGHNDGINIAAAAGTTVTAADDGVVAYAGNELRGYGNLVLIKHANGWMTAYAHNAALLVKRGQKVMRGEPIARVGTTGAVGEPQLHFEIRHGTKPMDPSEYLPENGGTARG